MSHASRAWWLEIKPYAPRKPRHRLASLRNPQKKSSFAFRICARPIFSEKGKDIFLWGSALRVFGQCGGAKCGLGFAKTIFWGKGFGKTSADVCFLNSAGRGEKGVWGKRI